MPARRDARTPVDTRYPSGPLANRPSVHSKISGKIASPGVRSRLPPWVPRAVCPHPTFDRVSKTTCPPIYERMASVTHDQQPTRRLRRSALDQQAVMPEADFSLLPQRRFGVSARAMSTASISITGWSRTGGRSTSSRTRMVASRQTKTLQKLVVCRPCSHTRSVGRHEPNDVANTRRIFVPSLSGASQVWMMFASMTFAIPLRAWRQLQRLHCR
jgi:hypothetical protein